MLSNIYILKKTELRYLQEEVKILLHLEEDETHNYYMLTAMFGEKLYTAYLDWCQEA
jgi:hypothetical protein